MTPAAPRRALVPATRKGTPALSPALLALALVPLLAGACALPPGDHTTPERAHYMMLSAREAGDLDAIWAALHPDIRDQFDRWVSAEKKAIRMLEISPYSDKDREAALAILGHGARAKAEDGRALFEAMMGPVEPVTLGLLTATGARVKGVTLVGDRATVRTWAGDEVIVRQSADGSWYATLPPEVAARVKAAADQAEANLQQIKDNVARLNAAGR